MQTDYHKISLCTINETAKRWPLLLIHLSSISPHSSCSFLACKRTHLGHFFLVSKQCLCKTALHFSQITARLSNGNRTLSFEHTSQICPCPMQISQSSFMCFFKTSTTPCKTFTNSPECVSIKSCKLYKSGSSIQYGNSTPFHNKWFSFAFRQTVKYFRIMFNSFRKSRTTFSSWIKENRRGLSFSRLIRGRFAVIFRSWKLAWLTGWRVKSQLWMTRAGITAALFQWQAGQ